MFRGGPDLEAPPAASLLEGPVDTRQVGIKDDARFSRELTRRLDFVDGEDLRRAMLGHLDTSHPPHGRIALVGADDIRRSDRLASHDDPLGSRDGVAHCDLVELRDPARRVASSTARPWKSVSPEDLEVLPSASSAVPRAGFGGRRGDTDAWTRGASSRSQRLSRPS